MRLVDASVFVHAYLKPNRELKPHEVRIKEAAKRMVKSINEGEEVAITIVQLSEIANILENYMPIEEAFKVEEFLLVAENVKVFEVTTKDCLEALEASKDKKVRLSDSIAYLSMLKHGINEIYSFDGDFDDLEDIKRVVEI